MSDAAAQTTSWREAWQSVWHPKVLAMLCLGFAAGVPILLIFSTLSVWLREADVARSSVTFFSWAALGYSFKFIWAPLIDRLPVPLLTAVLGRRRAWLLVSQAAIIGAILLIAAVDPQQHLWFTALAVVLLGFSSATQDIVIDAYRIESADAKLQAMMASSYIAGYRVGMLLAGAGALKLASFFADGEAYQYSAWAWAYRSMAGAMLLGVLTTLLIKEPQAPANQEQGSTQEHLRLLGLCIALALSFISAFLLLGDWLAPLKTSLENMFSAGFASLVYEALRFAGSAATAALSALLLIRLQWVPAQLARANYVEPIQDFLQRYQRAGWYLLLLIGCYRLSDITMGVIANVFYVDMGFTKDEIANIAKTFGLLMTLLGGFVGGLLALRYGLYKNLLLGAVLAAITNLLFAGLALLGPSLTGLIITIAADNLAAGMASAAFVAYLSSLTSLRFTATQYALFSSLMTLFPKLLAGYSGLLVEHLGYANFFTLTALLGVPVIALVWYLPKKLE